MFDDFIFTVSIYSFLAFGGVVCFTIHSILKSTPQRFRKIFERVGYFLFSCLFKIRVIGYPLGITRNKGIIFISNHNSKIDFLLPALVFGKINSNQIVGEMYDSNILSRSKLISYFLLRSPNVCVIRENGKDKIIQESVEFLNKGNSILIFPEGKRCALLSQFKNGAFEIAMKNNYIIQPLIFLNAKEYFPFENSTLFKCNYNPLTFKFLDGYTPTENDTPNSLAEKFNSIFKKEISTYEKECLTSTKYPIMKYISLLYIFPLFFVEKINFFNGVLLVGTTFLSYKYHTYNENCYHSIEKMFNIIGMCYFYFATFVTGSYYLILFSLFSLIFWVKGFRKPHCHRSHNFKKTEWNFESYINHLVWHIATSILFFLFFTDFDIQNLSF